MDKQTYREFVCAERLLVGWKAIGEYFQLPGPEMRDRFGKELRAANIVFDVYLFNGAPCAWKTRLQEWATRRGML